MLFSNCYLEYKFPAPQYLGAKYIHREWIGKYIPKDARVVLDAFSGSQSIAYLLKQLGKETHTNDLLSFNAHIGKALIENAQERLTADDVAQLFLPNSNPEQYSLIEGLYTGLFFTREEAALLDTFRSNIERLSTPFKQSLALTVMCRTLTRKVTMGHFAHTRALAYAANEERIQRNRSLVRPLREMFEELVPQYNDAIFDNQQNNRSYNENILELLPKLHGIDLVYFDPPYCDSHADYQSFYHLLETFVMYWHEKRFVNSIKRYEPKRFSGFDKKSIVLESFQQLFALAQQIPIWLISYNDRSFPDINTLTTLIAPYREVRVVYQQYQNSRGGKGSVAGSREALLVCTK